MNCALANSCQHPSIFPSPDAHIQHLNSAEEYDWRILKEFWLENDGKDIVKPTLRC